MVRRSEDEKSAKREQDNPIKLTYERTEKPFGFTENEFSDALKKASRKISESVSEKKETSE